MTPHSHTLADFRAAAEALWPTDTAESWDRVGLVTGANPQPVRRVLLAVDAVAATVDEALEWGADVLLTHHPLLLRGIHTVAEDTAKGELLSRLIRGGCALFAAHTNADQPEGGVSDVIAARLGVCHARPILPHSSDPAIGIGRIGELDEPISLRSFAESVSAALPPTVSGVRVAGDPHRLVQRIALLGGAGDSLLDHPEVRGADAYLTSDLRHHPAQEAVETATVAGGPALLDVAHWASESLWLDGAAERLGSALPGATFRVSRIRTDPWVFSVGASAE